MSILNNIIIKLGLSLEDCVGGDRISIFDGKGVFIEGHRGIFSYTDEQLVVKLKRGKVTVDGAALKIVELNNAEIYITGGKINAVTRE
ncbi:MAG: YabP/YqfC family sporulation protein [Clostridia bacterium]